MLQVILLQQLIAVQDIVRTSSQLHNLQRRTLNYCLIDANNTQGGHMKHVLLSLLFGGLLLTGMVCEVQAKSSKHTHGAKSAVGAKSSPAAPAA
jgi:hypothetical protein